MSHQGQKIHDRSDTFQEASDVGHTTRQGSTVSTPSHFPLEHHIHLLGAASNDNGSHPGERSRRELLPPPVDYSPPQRYDRLEAKYCPRFIRLFRLRPLL